MNNNEPKTTQERLQEYRDRWKLAKLRGDTKEMLFVEARVQLPPFNIKLKRDMFKESEDIFLSNNLP